MSLFLGAALLFGACALVGQAVLALAGRPRAAWYGPAIGLTTLIVVALVTVKWPGRAGTAAAACLAVTAVSAISLAVALRRRGRRPRIGWTPVVVVALAGLAASIPFIASGRVGALGMGINNDLALHILWAQGLRQPSVATWALVIPGYPLGPHSLVAAMADLGLRVDIAFQALLLATLPMVALGAGAFAERAAPWRRVAVALTGGFAYLISAYYGQAAFKEVILAAAFFAFIGYLRDLGRMAPASTVAMLRAVIPAALLVAGSIYAYSHVSLGWFGGFLVLWVAAALVTNPGAIRRALRRREVLLRYAGVAAGALLILVLVLLPQLGTIHTFADAIGTNPATNSVPVANLGNLVRPLSGFETLGVWMQPDYRFLPTATFHAGMWSAFAGGMVLLGLLILVARREFALPAAALAALGLFWYSQRTQSPYVTAKAQAIAAPVLVTSAMVALAGYERGLRFTPLQALRLGMGLLFAAAALWSAGLALRFSPVAQDAAPLRELAAVTGERPTLFFGHDDFISPEMQFGHLANPGLDGIRALPSFITGEYTAGELLDWDDFVPVELDRFDFALLPDGPFRSQAPPNFRRVASAGSYELYQRTGKTPPRTSIDPEVAPGRRLDCGQAPGRGILRRGGVAAIMTPPVSFGGVGGVAPGQSLSVSVSLPRGRWDLSLSYVSPLDVHVAGGGIDARLPAYLGRPGPYFDVGTVESRGRGPATPVTFTTDRPSFLTTKQAAASLGELVATRHEERRIVPVRQACGHYVDWLRLRPRAPGGA